MIHRLLPTIASIGLALFLAACSVEDDGPFQPGEHTFSVEGNIFMATAAIVHFDETAGDSITILYHSDDGIIHRTRTYPTSVERIAITGLRPETRYTFRRDNTLSSADTVSFTTGKLTSLPDVVVSHPSPGVDSGFYLVGYTGANPTGKYAAVIYDTEGHVVWYRIFLESVIDFQQQPNGNFTICVGQIDGTARFDEVNIFGEVIGSYQSETTPETGVHELRLYPDGGRLLYGVKRPHYDLTSEGGPADAEVKQCVVEYKRGSSLFTWSTEDGMALSDGIDPLDSDKENPFHVNAIDRDTDGNLLISLRNASQIVKVNIETGEVMWRLGGKRDQFLWLGDPLSGFSRQHSIRRLPNGNILLFDNGNEHTPPVSRAVEYMLDEHFKYATYVWEYSDPTLFGAAMGSAQRLENGNTLICFGTAQVIREVSTGGNVEFQLTVSGNEQPYRAFKVSSLQ